MAERTQARLGEALVRRGLLTAAQLQEAVAKQKLTGARLGEILVELGHATEEDVLEALSQQWGIPWASLADPAQPLYPVTDRFPLKFMKHYGFFPLELTDGTLTVVMRDPHDEETLEDIRLRSGCRVAVRLGSDREIQQALDRCYGSMTTMKGIIRDLGVGDAGFAADEDQEDVDHLRDLASEAPVIKLVNLIMSRAVQSRASDIHIEPFEDRLAVRYRVDGILVDAESPPRRLHAAVVSRVKIMAKMNIAERRLPQDGRMRLQMEGKELDLRISTVPTIYGESVVMRILDRSSIRLGLKDLGFADDTRERFEAMIRRPHGILLVTGPTGSGKTTTLYAALHEINSTEKKIITIEDPVEYQLPGVNQIQVKPKIGLSFANGLRSIVRQDPDVIMVGEIRDAETAEIAIHSALTGHLVLSTLHTNDAPGAITRLLDMGIENYLASSCLIGVLAQRLVRRLCPHCRVADLVAPEVRATAAGRRGPGSLARAWKGQGCPECGYAGYYGRIGIYELLALDEEIQQLILARADANVIRKAAIGRGMTTLREDGWLKVLDGVTAIPEVIRVTQEEA
jgi:general secretion pathway protein E